MSKITAAKIIFFISFFVIAVQPAYAECYNEDTCYKAYVSQKDQNTVIAVNRDTNDVELYWSDKDSAWLKPDTEYQKQLQKMFEKKLQLQQMQQSMNDMSRNSWYNKNQSSSGHR